MIVSCSDPAGSEPEPTEPGPEPTDTLSNEIVFVSDSDGDDDIYVMNADGTGRTQLTKDSPLDSNPVFSPDGPKIAFFSYDYDREDSDIYVVNADGSGLIVNLTDNASSAEGGHDWSPAE
ncbi:hypothetical protein LQ318_10575 [Aliifodinibius salicampi]|uniref:WD40-like Beta Propeller Repeat n=1 Tax=Fodinibius salicampi TaxID=1920655 RepID=A0ABT3PZT4_9BACT|nr:hypothetical protein [Fodinibius salicampi]MCW9713352.1 hypothetical protein [Fodinibius salicampi]